ncbi:pyridoxamine 5'-phosphate oxidase family protein [Streptomyces albulus]|uniref:pyridoxamine 5'-phosphate oxidase family protein n=1 Tax=Streptomyces noursei TaxID=1971 RepID=UPI0022BFF142|nr:pyridoxamine 5'-phosphate oxidase family protein [Streptomyces noursei]
MSDLVNELGPAVRLRLAEEKNVWLCTVRPDGSAHVTPVWFVYQSSRWWIGSDHSSVKVRNIRKEPRVSLALEDGRFPVVAEGEAALIRDGFPRQILTAFEQKYGWDVSAPTRSGSKRVLLKVHVRRWLLAGAAQ